jgi:hypothetical protein
MVEVNGDEGCFSRLVSPDPFWHQLSVSGDKNFLLSLVQEGQLSVRKFYLLLGRKEEVSESPLNLSFLK